MPTTTSEFNRERPEELVEPEGRELEPLVDDLSLYVRGGRLHSSAGVIVDAVDAERLGLRRLWLSERYDLKEAGALLGGMAARTSRIGIATAAVFPGSRPPILTAALGATMHSAYGPRFTLGLGRSTAENVSTAGLHPISFEKLVDYVDLFRRLWKGEWVDYDGPIGTFKGLHMADTYDGPPPEIYSVNQGGPRACKVAASGQFDGVFLQPFLTTEAIHNSVGWIRAECERIGRDPSEVRVVAPIVSAPEMSEEQERAYLHARMVTYVCAPSVLDLYGRLNAWDVTLGDPVRHHEMFRADPERVDHHFHRLQLLEIAKLVPDEWVYPTSLTGSIEACVQTMQAYRDAGADEICFYGSTAAENAKLTRAWREHSLIRDGVAAQGS
ncbi:MAG: TIGR03857 family LLM class F420-dependent oxidoreductase [Solirubrobacteraceae bacterium]